MTARLRGTGAILIAGLIALAACSNEESRAKKSYLIACNLALRNQEICSCTYDKLREKHSAEELRQASTNGEMPSPELARDMAQATLDCVKRVQAGS